MLRRSNIHHQLLHDRTTFFFFFSSVLFLFVPSPPTKKERDHLPSPLISSLFVSCCGSYPVLVDDGLVGLKGSGPLGGEGRLLVKVSVQQDRVGEALLKRLARDGRVDLTEDERRQALVLQHLFFFLVRKTRRREESVLSWMVVVLPRL